MASGMYQGHSCWWEPEEGGKPVHQAVWDTVLYLRDAQQSRSEELRRLYSLYANGDMVSLDAATYEHSRSEPEENPRFNMLRSMVDSAQSRLAKNRPRAAVLTSGGDWGEQQQAKRLEKFIEGIFGRNKLYRLAPLCFRDAEILKTGILKVYSEAEGDTGRIRMERVYPWEIYIDPVEAYYGDPRSIFQMKWIDRRALAAAYPDHEDAIMESTSAMPLHGGGDPGRDAFADQLCVIEGWRRESRDDAGDGKHVICLEDVELVNEVWVGDAPFAFVHWTKPVIGFWGDALVEEAEGMQLEVNELLAKISDAMSRVSGMWLCDEASSVKEDHLEHAGESGVVLKYSGIKPDYETPAPLHPEYFAHLDRLISMGYRVVGISELFASAKKPSGLDAAVALREFNDIESERFMVKGQQYEDFFLDVAKLCIAEARRLKEAGYDVEVTAEERRRRKTFLTQISWSDADLDRDSFILRMFPASSLPHSPAGRLNTVQELMQSGVISREEGKLLLDFPDLEATMERDLSPFQIILDKVERMLDEGQWVPPDPFDDLELAMGIVRKAYLRAQIDGAPEERLDLLRTWVSQAHALLQRSEQPAVPTGAAPTPFGAPERVNIQQMGAGPAPQGPPPSPGPPQA